MIPLITTGMLGLLGYSLRDMNDPDKQMDQEILKKQPTVSNNQIPSAENIYHNRRSDEVFNDELKKCTDVYPRHYAYEYLHRNYPKTAWDKKIRAKSNRVVQLEKDIIQSNYPQNTTTKLSSASVNAIKKTDHINRLNLQNLVDIQSKIPFNARRNTMPDPNFVQIGESSNHEPIFKTNFQNKKNVTVFGENTHNNMEPFYSGHGVKQNNVPDANRTTLEHFTGTAPVYKHKTENLPFFQPTKDPYAVAGIPVIKEIEKSRFAPSINENNALPFEQIRVGPGLNNSSNDLDTNIGFHDPYRPIGLGVFKDVNELRVNPKLTYTGRVSGEQFFIPHSGKTAPVISRRPYKDLSFTNFTPNGTTECTVKPDGTNTNIALDLKLRETLPVKSSIDKGKILDKDTVILRDSSREDTGGNLEHYPSPVLKDVKRNTTYFFDQARGTLKEETEDNEHDRVNLTAEYSAQRNQTYFFDKARHTLKEETENNEHDRVNLNAEQTAQRNQTYFFDTAKETICEQTEDNPYDRINLTGEQSAPKSQSYYFDTAKETIREQTENHTHNRINTNATGSVFSLHDITAFLNASINALKEWGLAKHRPPTTVGPQLIVDKTNIGNYESFRRQQFDTYEHSKKFEPVNMNKNVDKLSIGDSTEIKTQYPKDVIQQSEQINPFLVEAFKQNPYTHSLQSWQPTYNPTFPVVHQAPNMNSLSKNLHMSAMH